MGNVKDISISRNTNWDVFFVSCPANYERRMPMGRRRKPKPPDINFLSENSLPRYVSTDFICEKYEISNVQCKEMARAAGAFYEITGFVERFM